MRSLLYIVICTVGLVCVTPALANKAQSANSVALKLNESVVSGQSLILDTSLSSLTDFHRGSVELRITTKDGTAIGEPIKVLSAKGSSQFGAVKQVQLPPLRPGRYKVQALFSVFHQRLDKHPKITGSNLYLDVSAKQVLSSTVSFSQIERLSLKKQLQAQGININGQNPARIVNMKLRQALENANAVSTVNTHDSKMLVAENSDLQTSARQVKETVKTVTLSTPQLEAADPRKQLRRKSSGLDRANAILESAVIEQEQ